MNPILLGAVLKHLGAIDDTQYQQLAGFFAPSITNSRGEAIGHVDVAKETGFAA